MLARAVPLALLAAAGVYLALALGLPFGALARPGPGFYPVVVGVFAAVVALAAVVSALRRPVRAASGGEEELGPAARRRVAGSMVALAAFCLALPWVGYPAAAFGFVAVVLRQLGSGWASALLTGALSS